MKVPKKAKFWIRFLGKTIDFLLVALFLGLVLIFNVSKVKNNLVFTHPYNFYLWTSIVILVLFLYFYLLPVLTKGFTLGFWIVGIRIKYGPHPWKAQAIRESTFSFIYIINALALMSIINHSLINQFVQSDMSVLNKLGAWAKARISFYITITSIGILINMIVGISIIVKKGEGLNDLFSKTQTIYRKKFTEVKRVKRGNKNHYQPQPVKPIIIEWIE